MRTTTVVHGVFSWAAGMKRPQCKHCGVSFLTSGDLRDHLGDHEAVAAVRVKADKLGL